MPRLRLGRPFMKSHPCFAIISGSSCHKPRGLGSNTVKWGVASHVKDAHSFCNTGMHIRFATSLPRSSQNCISFSKESLSIHFCRFPVIIYLVSSFALVSACLQPGHVRTNAWAAVPLRLDLAAALAEGFKFGMSTNGVSLLWGRCASVPP